MQVVCGNMEKCLQSLTNYYFRSLIFNASDLIDYLFRKVHLCRFGLSTFLDSIRFESRGSRRAVNLLAGISFLSGFLLLLHLRSTNPSLSFYYCSCQSCTFKVPITWTGSAERSFLSKRFSAGGDGASSRPYDSFYFRNWPKIDRRSQYVIKKRTNMERPGDCGSR